MPIYEYQCEACGRVSSVFFQSLESLKVPGCRYCGDTRMTRIMSRFATIRSEEDRLESLADPSKFGDLDERDPKSIARWAKRMGKELGEDLGEDFDQAMEAAMEDEYGPEGEGEELE